MFPEDGAVVTLALLPTPLQESGVVLFMSSVSVSYLKLLLLLCVFLSPVCTDLLICRSARLRCLIQVSCHLTLLLSRPVKKPLNWPTFFYLFFLRGISVWLKVGETRCQESLICLFGDRFFFLRFRRRERKTRHTARCDERSWLRHSRQQYVTWHRRDACLLRLLHRRLSTEVVFVKCILACASFICPRPVFAFFWQPRWALRPRVVGREAYRDDTLRTSAGKQLRRTLRSTRFLEGLCSKMSFGGSLRLRWSPCEDDCRGAKQWAARLNCSL